MRVITATTGTSYIFLGSILALVVYLSVTKRDQTPPELIAKDLGAAWPDPPVGAAPDHDREDQAHLSRRHILVVTDHAEPTEPVLAAIRARAADGAVDVRVVVPNPASAEWHPLHPERHEQAKAARKTLDEALPRVAQACGGEAQGLTSADHDPFDAIEQSLRDRPFDEILVFTAPHGMRGQLHLDLPHRLAHVHVPVTEVADDTAGSDAAAGEPPARI